MSRLRHRSSGHKKTLEKKIHKAAGGEAEVGNPKVFALAKGHTIGTIHGKGGASHLGDARGGKAGRKHRAKGGGANLNPYSSAGGPLGGHHEMAKGGKCMERGGGSVSGPHSSEHHETVIPHEKHGGGVHGHGHHGHGVKAAPHVHHVSHPHVDGKHHSEGKKK